MKLETKLFPKLNKFKNKIDSIEFEVNCLNSFIKKVNYRDDHTVKIGDDTIFILRSIIDFLIENIDDFNYDYADDEGIIFTTLNNFAISIYEKSLECINIINEISIHYNKIELKNNDGTIHTINQRYEPHSNRAFIIEQLLHRCKNFEIWMYANRYSVDAFFKELVEKLSYLKFINPIQYKQQNILHGLLSEFKQNLTKKQFSLVCKIIQFLSNKNIQWGRFVWSRNAYIHEGKSTFDTSEIPWPIDMEFINDNFLNLLSAFCSFLLNYTLVILYLESKIIK